MALLGNGDPDGLFGEQTGQNYIVALTGTPPAQNTTYTDLRPEQGQRGLRAQALNGWYLPLASTETVTNTADTVQRVSFHRQLCSL
jgi:hypothetical protein